MAEVLGPLHASSFDNLNRFSISPTLVTQELNVDIQLYSAEDIQLQIIDPLGRKIWEQQFFTLDQSLSLSIPSEWNAGMYFLVLRGQSGLRSTKRFLKK
jgi:hypothetical protein